jgi:hypothetical protein
MSRATTTMQSQQFRGCINAALQYSSTIECEQCHISQGYKHVAYEDSLDFVACATQPNSFVRTTRLVSCSDKQDIFDLSSTNTDLVRNKTKKYTTSPSRQYAPQIESPVP